MAADGGGDSAAEGVHIAPSNAQLAETGGTPQKYPPSSALSWGIGRDLAETRGSVEEEEGARLGGTGVSNIASVISSMRGEVENSMENGSVSSPDRTLDQSNFLDDDESNR
jgi:hypothetical protein